MSRAVFLIAILFSTVSAWSSGREYYLKQVPILHGGRVKPLDTFARVTLNEFLQKESLPDLGPSAWLLEVLFDQKEAYKRKIFKINNPDLLKILKLEPSNGHSYDFIEVFSALDIVNEQIDKLLSRGPEELTPDQKQLTTLYNNIYKYLNLSRSFSMFLPELELTNRELSEALMLPAGRKLSYFEIVQTKWRLRNFLKNTEMKDQSLMMDTAKIIKFLKFYEDDKFADALKIIPPPEVPAGQNFTEQSWLSPWSIDFSKQGDISSLSRWHDLYKSYKGEEASFNQAAQSIYDHGLSVSTNNISPSKLLWEVRYNQYKLFKVAFVLYLLSFLIFIVHLLTDRKSAKITSLLALSVGALAHFINLAVRCYLLGRPPVSNLYESILFVGLIGVLFALVMERFRYQYSTLIGSVMGALLLLVSFGYEKEGDSMGMLVAVLDTNFWLAFHVITISIGYGCALVTSLMAHLFLAKKSFQNESRDDQLKKQIHYCSLFSLFFVIVGTMLGGIWADQSWGRFWGWDPKENGALLICLWLLWVVHGKIAGILKESSYMIFTALTSIVVVLAWFGVNLLNVGLHSYGFTDSIANNILMFVIAEALINGLFVAKLISRKTTTAAFSKPAEDTCCAETLLK